MRYQCDTCGCYLDPGEGRTCDECMERAERRDEAAKGYRGFGPEAGRFVRDEDAFQYALARCLYGTPEERGGFKSMLMDWYYSGNWTREDAGCSKAMMSYVR